MVATVEEGRAIIKLLLKRFQFKEVDDLIKEVWIMVGTKTTNASLSDTIKLLQQILEDEWEYSLQNQPDTPFQVLEH